MSSSESRIRLTDVENILVSAKGEGDKRRDWEFGMSRDELSYTGWIKSKVLLYSMWNYLQCPVINHNTRKEKNMNKNEYIYIYIWLNCFYIAEIDNIVNQLCFKKYKNFKSFQSSKKERVENK